MNMNQAPVWCGLLLATANAFAQTINVVVLDGKNGHAMRDAVVWVQFYEAPANRVLQRIQYKTGPDGVVRVALATPPPVQLTVSASVDSFCVAFLTVATIDLVARGAVAVSRCNPKPSHSPPKPTPGEVRLLVRRIPWWVRLLAPLESG
jgi:hypothetical protein